MARPRTPEDRRARAREIERREKAGRALKIAVIGVLSLAVVAGAAYGISKLPKAPRDVHWHAKYQVYVNDRLESFANPKFDGLGRLEAHLHSPEWDVIHNEGKEGAGTLRSFFDLDLGGHIADDVLTLPQGVSVPGTFKASGNSTLSVFVSNQATGQDWTRIASNYAGVQFHDGDRILILYGAYSDARVAELQRAFPDFDPAKVG